MPRWDHSLAKQTTTAFLLSLSPQGKIIRHLHRRIGHYLEKHICTPEVSIGSWSQTLFTLTDMKHLLKMAQRGLIHSPLQFTKSLPFISLTFGSGLRVANRMSKEESLRRMKNKKEAGVTAAVIKYKFSLLQNRIVARNIYRT